MVLPHCSMPTFYPENVLNNIPKPDIKGVDHYTQFLDAIEGKDKTLAGFDYSGPWLNPSASVWSPVVPWQTPQLERQKNEGHQLTRNPHLKGKVANSNPLYFFPTAEN